MNNVLLLRNCVEQAVLTGEVVTARMLQRRFGGDIARITDQLNAMVKAGDVTVFVIKPPKSRKRVPFKAYRLSK